MKIKFSKSPVMMLAKLALAGLLCLVIVFIVHSNYKSRQGSRIELKSRYTFSVRIDSDGMYWMKRIMKVRKANIRNLKCRS